MKSIPAFLRTLFSASLFVSCCLSSRADGWLLFNNTGPTSVYQRDPITLQLSPVPVINGGKVEFLYAPLGTMDFSLFKTVAGKSPVSFAPIPGRFNGGTYVLTDIEPGAVVSALVRGWTGSFATWEEAVNSGTAKIGISGIFSVDTTDPNELPVPAPPPTIVTSGTGQGFTGLILQIPEPSSLALCGFSVASLFAIRRRQSNE